MHAHCCKDSVKFVGAMLRTISPNEYITRIYKQHTPTITCKLKGESRFVHVILPQGPCRRLRSVVTSRFYIQLVLLSAFLENKNKNLIVIFLGKKNKIYNCVLF